MVDPKDLETILKSANLFGVSKEKWFLQSMANVAVDLENLIDQMRTLNHLYKPEKEALVSRKHDSMMASPATAETCLRDPDPIVRLEALRILRDYWHLDLILRKNCEAIATSDPDPSVKELALVILGSVFAGTNDRRICEVFASVILDENRRQDTRLAAYFSLFSVVGIPAEEVPLFRGLRVPEGIDHDFVNQFRNPQSAEGSED